jgi:hypothetical protein
MNAGKQEKQRRQGAAIEPMNATPEPAAPWKRTPSATATFMMLPPGRN